MAYPIDLLTVYSCKRDTKLGCDEGIQLPRERALLGKSVVLSREARGSWTETE
jgi:hypothetical protein